MVDVGGESGVVGDVDAAVDVTTSCVGVVFPDDFVVESSAV
jgi:hypothetical protein